MYLLKQRHFLTEKMNEKNKIYVSKYEGRKKNLQNSTVTTGLFLYKMKVRP